MNQNFSLTRLTSSLTLLSLIVTLGTSLPAREAAAELLSQVTLTPGDQLRYVYERASHLASLDGAGKGQFPVVTDPGTFGAFSKTVVDFTPSRIIEVEDFPNADGTKDLTVVEVDRESAMEITCPGEDAFTAFLNPQTVVLQPSLTSTLVGKNTDAQVKAYYRTHADIGMIQIFYTALSGPLAGLLVRVSNVLPGGNASMVDPVSFGKASAADMAIYQSFYQKKKGDKNPDKEVIGCD